MPTVDSTKAHLFSRCATLAKPVPSPLRVSAIRRKNRTRLRKWNTAQTNAATSSRTPATIQVIEPPRLSEAGAQTFSKKKGPKLLHLRASAPTSSSSTATTSHTRSHAMVPRALS